MKNKVKILRDNLVNCCSDADNDTSTSKIEELEKTISDLSDENTLKDRHIQKLIQLKQLFENDASLLEDEVNTLIKSQEAKIVELNSYIDQLSKKLEACTDREWVSIGTQCDISTTRIKTCSGVGVQTDGVGSDRVADLVNISNIVNEATNQDRVEVAHTSANMHHNKILFLSDEMGKNIKNKLRKDMECNGSQLLSFIKPNASLADVMEDTQGLCSHFTTSDAVIIMAGSRDFKSGRYPSLGIVSRKLRLVSQTNVVMCSVPYTRNPLINQKIYKYNCKLNDLVLRLNRVTEGHFVFYDINTQGTSLIWKTTSNDIVNILSNFKPLSKNLIFVLTHSNVLESQKHFLDQKTTCALTHQFLG